MRSPRRATPEPHQPAATEHREAKFLKPLGLLGHIACPGSFGADTVLRSLADTLAHRVTDVVGLHIFTFNQVRSTVASHQRLVDELSIQSSVQTASTAVDML